MDALCVGEMVIDFLPGSEPDSYIRRAGGAPANVAVALARQGCRAAFCGMMGDDDFGRFLLDTLRTNGVRPCVTSLTREATTTMAFVSLDEHGDRSFTFARKPGADMLLHREHVRSEDLNAAALIHAGSCSLSKDPAADATAYALREGHRLGKLVSFDVNYRDLMWDGDEGACARAVCAILPEVDILKVSGEETEMFGGEEGIPALMRKNRIAVTVVTLGAEGARCYWRDKVLYCHGLKTRAVDTCGAGDAFWGAFLATLLKGGVRAAEDLSEGLLARALQAGNIAGCLCVQKKGAMESLPGAEEIERYRQEVFGT